MPAAIVVAATVTGASAAIGTAVVGAITTATISTAVATAVGSGIIAGTITAAQGGSTSDVLKSAVIAGTVSYVGGQASSQISGTVSEATGLSTQASNVVAGATVGAGISSLAGGDPLAGAIAGTVGAIGSTTYATEIGTVLGAEGAAAPIVGNAVINAGLSGIAAAATGGNVEKSMLAGAVRGAAMVGANEFSLKLCLAKKILQIFQSATGLSKPQVESIFTTSVANGIAAEITDQGELLEVM
jgi:hypothetical protein